MADILSNLKYAQGSRKKKKRIGRGQGSGHGGTSTRGHKGQGSRSGSGEKRNFEGGQMPLVRRVPKFGFRALNRVEFAVINVSDLQKLIETKKVTDGVFTPEVFYSIGAVSKKNTPIKILGDGELQSKVQVTAHKFSKSAAEKITNAGGTVAEIAQQQSAAKK